MKLGRHTARILSLGALWLMVACSGDPPPAEVPPTALPPAQSVQQVPQNAIYNAGYNYTEAVLIPQLQAQLGNVQILDNVVGGGFNIPAGTYSWTQLYHQFILPSFQNCGCYVSGAPQQVGYAAFAYMNYGQLNQVYGGYYNSWDQARVVYQARPGYIASFYEVYSLLVSSNYTYYSQYYYQPGYFQGGNYPMYYYQPQYQNQTGLFFNYAQGGANNYQVNLDFFWNKMR